MALKCAYRQAPISRWVYTPPWGPYASQDVPLKGAVSGEMTIKITTLTSTCVGGAREANWVQPFRLHADGQLAVPKSTLDGLLRSTLEVVTFGRLGEFVEKRFPGMRIIEKRPSATVRKHYSNRMAIATNAGEKGVSRVTSWVKAGWLRKIDERVSLVPCDLGRADIRAVKRQLGIREGDPAWTSIANGDNTVPERYSDLGFELDSRFHRDNSFDDRFSFLVDSAEKLDHEHRNGTLLIHEMRHEALEGGSIDATLVVSGKPEASDDPYGQGKKKREFLFSNPSRRELIADPDRAQPHSDFPAKTFDAFQYLTSRSHGGRRHAGWEFWEPFFERCEPVPVFYIEEGGSVTAMGMAQGFKAAFGADTHDLLKNSSEEHLAEPSISRLPDFPSTLLGEAAFYASDEEGAETTGRAGRVTFTPAVAMQLSGSLETEQYVLSSPKEGYYPLYVRQDEYSDPAHEPMATYVNVTDPRERREFVRKPELAGTKIWPAGTGDRKQEKDPDQGQNEDTGAGSTISFVPAGTEFEGRLVFHNVLPQELGAVIWALTAGGEGNAKPVLRLGTAKAYAHGEVEIELTGLKTTVGELANFDDAVTAFTNHMEEVVAASGLDGKWNDTKQVQAILESRERSDLDLGVMTIGEHDKERRKQSLLDPFPPSGVEFEKGQILPTTPPVVEPELDFVPPAGTAVRMRKGANSHADRIGQMGVVGEETLTRKGLMIYFNGETQGVRVKLKDLFLL